MTTSGRWRAQADLARDLRKGVAGIVVGEAGAALRHEERGRVAVREEAVAGVGVARENRGGGRMHRHESRFAKFRPANGEEACVERHIRIVNVCQLEPHWGMAQAD